MRTLWFEATIDAEGRVLRRQVALGTYLGVHEREGALLGHLEAAVQRGRSCLAAPAAGGSVGAVCLLPCHRWNYCHDDQSCCTSPGRLPLELTSREQLERAGVAVLHQACVRNDDMSVWVDGHIALPRIGAPIAERSSEPYRHFIHLLCCLRWR